MKLSIKTQPDPILREISKEQDLDEILKSEDTCSDLIETMIDWDNNFAHKDEHAVAIAAIQVGLKKRITILRSEALKELNIEKFKDTEYSVFINPEITARSKELETGHEGCLSVPGFYGIVKRPSWVRVRYTDIKGNRRAIKAKGFLARIFVHEIEHMEGLLFIDSIEKGKTKTLFEFADDGALIDTELSLNELLSKYANKEFKK